MKAVAPPSSAVTHIQKIAPGPPRQIAVDTPMMLPVPTRDAVEIMSAPNEEMLPSLSGFSMMTLHASLNRRIWMNLQRNVK